MLSSSYGYNWPVWVWELPVVWETVQVWYLTVANLKGQKCPENNQVTSDLRGSHSTTIHRTQRDLASTQWNVSPHFNHYLLFTLHRITNDSQDNNSTSPIDLHVPLKPFRYTQSNHCKDIFTIAQTMAPCLPSESKSFWNWGNWWTLVLGFKRWF